MDISLVKVIFCLGLLLDCLVWLESEVLELVEDYILGSMLIWWWVLFMVVYRGVIECGWSCRWW